MYPGLVDEHLRAFFPRTLGTRPDYFELQGVQDRFLIAVLATELHAMSSLMQPIEATRTRAAAVQQMIACGALAGERLALFDKVEETLCAVERAPDTLATAIGRALYEPLGCLEMTELGGVTYAEPATELAIGFAVVVMTSAWWKRFLETYRIVG